MPADPDVWSGFALDPRRAEHAVLRAGDADRELVHGELVAAYADGRLDRAELDERVEALADARTLGALLPLLADLVPDRPDRTPYSRRTGSLVGLDHHDLVTRAEASWATDRRRAVLGWLAPSLVCWTVWTSIAIGTGATFPWPLIVTVATLLPLLRITLTHRDRVAADVRRLERRQERQERQQRQERPRKRGDG